MPSVDRKIAFDSAPSTISAGGYSGPARTFISRQVKNPKVTSTGEVITPTSTTLSITSIHSTSVA